MKEYDAIIVGSGAGMAIADEAIAHEWKVALVDSGPLGGTCPNVGCIPSKMLIYPADRIMEMQDSKKLGVEATINRIDFSAIMARMKTFVQENQKHMREGVTATKGLDFFEGTGHFTAPFTMEVNGTQIKGKKVIIASGSRPLVPPIKGLDTVSYLTNETLLQLRERPESLIIIGGGYVAVEFAHFFAAVGTKVTMLEMADRLVLSEEPEIAALLKEELSQRMTVRTGAQAEEVRQDSAGVTVVTTEKATGARKEYTARQVMVAVGRRSNADLLKVENTGVELDKKGFVKVNEYMETSQKNIWAIGDADGQQMFTHVANREAAIAAHNAIHGAKAKMDYSTTPHAIFSHPQVASVGMGEAEARLKHKVLVGRARYSDVANGEAMMEETGFAKAIVEHDSGRILGFHIIGPYASILIQEVVNAMASGGNMEAISAGMHIHPALPELIPRTLANLEEPEETAAPLAGRVTT